MSNAFIAILMITELIGATDNTNSILDLSAKPSHPHPYLMPPAEKQRLLKSINENEMVRKQFDKIKERADQGNFYDSALVFAIEGGEKYANITKNHLLRLVEYRSPRLDEDILAGGHREGNMDFYWDTLDIRAYDLIYPALTKEERHTIETFYRKLGNYWKESLSRWTTTPNLVFPIHYHSAVIGFCIDDKELIEWGLQDSGGKFGPSKGGLFPVLDSMLRDGAIWDEATIYAAVNVLQPMVQLAILYKLYYGKDLFSYESPKGGSIKKLIDGYIAITYPLERTGVGPGSFHIATYGDGSTESPYSAHHNTDSIYLINLPWVRGNDRYELTNTLEQAYYVSRDPKYAWFLSHSVEREPSFLYGEDIPFGSVDPPPAPSSIFPEAGIAMLRSDESPNYWTNGSIAVLQMMSRGYGHDHRDKMMIIMHAGGRLLYPDMNCIQYEPPSINWTASSVAHNTLVVDRGKTANAPFTYRHSFCPEIKFLATTASCYPGVIQTRVLALTSEYLFDAFWADSDLPHTYDWVLHAIGKLYLENPTLYKASSDLLQDYWWIENERSRETDETWQVNFVQKNGLAIRGMGRQTDEWFNDSSSVQVTMIGEPNTIVYGADGPSGGPPVDPVMNPEGNIPILLARRYSRQTVFAVVHEPYKQNPPNIDLVQKISESKDAYIAKIQAKNYTDWIAVSFGDQNGEPIHILIDEHDPKSVFVFRNYGYLRKEISSDGKTSRLIAKGNWIGFRLLVSELPDQNALIVNDEYVQYKKDGDYLVFGDISETPKAEKPIITEADLPLEVTKIDEPIRLAISDSRIVGLQLRNHSNDTQIPIIRIRLPKGINVEPSDNAVVNYSDESENWNNCTWALPSIAPNQISDVNFRLTTDDKIKRGLHIASIQITNKSLKSWTSKIAFPITIGTVLTEDNSFPTFGEYVIYAPKYIMRMSKRYGTSRFLRDNSNRPRYEANFWDRRPASATTPDALPRLRVEDKDILGWGIPANFLWPNTAPAVVTVGTNRSRITWTFEDDAIRIEPMALWSAEAPHEFIFPGDRFGWVTWGEKPKWISVVILEDSGDIKVLSEPKSDKQKIIASALMVPGYEDAICFAVDRPQMAQFNNSSISIAVLPGEPIWFGLSKPDEFEKWWRSRVSLKKDNGR
ncbi:TPA: hypothetical protein ENX78_08370 [Candidatus Poribacteria bacterium]|nr:hypothetical protein [Candidatus Poribacteria bacterium]